MNLFSLIEQYREANFDYRKKLIQQEIAHLQALSLKSNLNVKESISTLNNTKRFYQFISLLSSTEKEAEKYKYKISPKDTHTVYHLPKQDAKPTTFLFHGKEQYQLTDKIKAPNLDLAKQQHASKIQLLKILSQCNISEDKLRGFNILKIQLFKTLIITTDYSRNNLEKLIKKCIDSYQVPKDEQYSQKIKMLEDFHQYLIKNIEPIQRSLPLTHYKQLEGVHYAESSIVNFEQSTAIYYSYEQIKRGESNYYSFDLPTIIANLDKFDPEEVGLLLEREIPHLSKIKALNQIKINKQYFDNIREKLEIHLVHLDIVKRHLEDQFKILRDKLETEIIPNPIHEKFHDLIIDLLNEGSQLLNDGEINLTLLEILDKTYRVINHQDGITWEKYLDFCKSIEHGKSNLKLKGLGAIMVAIAIIGLALLPSPINIIFAGAFTVASIYGFFRSRNYGLNKITNSIAQKGNEKEPENPSSPIISQVVF